MSMWWVFTLSLLLEFSFFNCPQTFDSIKQLDLCIPCCKIIYNKNWIEHFNGKHFSNNLTNTCFCNLSFPLYHQLVIHFVKEHIKKEYVCPCDYESTSLQEALLHLQSNCPEKTHKIDLTCPEFFDDEEFENWLGVLTE